jgi:hypothetical protein
MTTDTPDTPDTGATLLEFAARGAIESLDRGLRVFVDPRIAQEVERLERLDAERAQRAEAV